MKYALFVLALLILPTLALAATSTSPGFVPLTNIPFIQEAGNAFNLDQFLNGLYRICIGAAAVLAVLQIMRAGIMYMGGDSVTEKKEAKNLIALSIGGLILVLSPVVVFSIINPEILSLKIGGIEDLRVENIATTTSTLETQSANQCQAFSSITIVSAGPSCSEYGEGWAPAPSTCCSAADSSFQCCGKPKATTNNASTQSPDEPDSTSSQTTPNPDSLGAGPFSSQSEAARAALTHSNALSITDNLEYGGVIYKDSEGQYWSGPIKGTVDGVQPFMASAPSESEVVGFFHTHGDYSVVDSNGNTVRTSDPRKDDYNSDAFSKTDINLINERGRGVEGYRGYLGTPSGKFIYFDPNTQTSGRL